MGKKTFGVTVIELLIVLTLLGILLVAILFNARQQLAKGRYARRKADLAKIKKSLEDYMNDNGCYPNSLNCGDNFSPYLSSIPCDPLNNSSYNYFYSYDGGEACKSWYKLYAKLENTKDVVIKGVGCQSGCGPSGNYNYWIASPNMNEGGQTEGEVWWPEIPGVSPSYGITETPTPITPSTTTVTSTPTPTPTFPAVYTSTPTPTGSIEQLYGCFSGICKPLSLGEECFPKYDNSSCYNNCQNQNGEPINECIPL